MDSDVLSRTGLYDLHVRLGAKMVPFAGYEMPVQYPMGVMQEHLHTRAHAGLFDVSHMGQVVIRPRSGDVADAARAMERLVPVDILALAPGRQRYAMFTNPKGGILDDLMVANRGDHLFVVVNAACKAADIAHMTAHLSDACEVVPVTDRALVALQGPGAEGALAQMAPDVAQMRFMDVRTVAVDGAECWISRSGYSGEDGFEISVPASGAMALAEALLTRPGVAPVGLGARDSLRLEAGLCLYGADLTPDTTPVEAALTWAIQKSRRVGGDRPGGYPGADVIARQLAEGPGCLRVGLRPDGRAPMRPGTPVFAGDVQVGVVTSGAYGPSVAAPISMAMVDTPFATPGQMLEGEVRGKRMPVTVAPLPFHPTSYKR